MITKVVAAKVLNAALSTGADFAEIFVEKTFQDTTEFENDKVSDVTSAVVSGAGIRILKGLQSVYGYSNDLSLHTLLKLAEHLSASFTGEQQIQVENFESTNKPTHHKAKKSYLKTPKEEKIDLMRRGYIAASSYDPRIVRTSIRFLETVQKIEIYNSREQYFQDTRERGRYIVTCYASENGAIETGYEGPGAQQGMEFFTKIINVEEVAKKAAKQAITMLHAEECPSGKMDVVIGNGFGGVIFHEACGHSLEASSVSKGLSVFSGKLGERIASDVVSARDDGTIEGGWGSLNIDDEGTPTQNKLLIDHGILKSYMVDSFNGRRMSVEGNGSCRRQSYKYEPTSRMTNTFICQGESTPEEIIAATEYGLYAKSMGGGSVNPATGMFNFACREAYLIEHGKITTPVKGATLIGNGASILFNIDMVGNDLERAQGMCGASSGSIPTDVGQPTLRVRDITVGGRGGKKE